MRESLLGPEVLEGNSDEWNSLKWSWIEPSPSSLRRWLLWCLHSALDTLPNWTLNKKKRHENLSIITDYQLVSVELTASRIWKSKAVINEERRGLLGTEKRNWLH
jgi:hypothetical protein